MDDTNASEFVIRRYTGQDARGLVELLTECFGRWPGVDIPCPPVKHLRWKLQSRADGASSQVVAERDGRIVGCLLGLFQQIRLCGRLVQAHHGMDTVVHPSFQGMGLLTRMAAFAQEAVFGDFDLRFGDTGHPAALRHYLHTHQPFGNPILILRHEPAGGEQQSRRSGRPVVRELPGFDDRFDEFFEDAARPFDFIVVRTREYLAWRYGDMRGGEFAIRTVEDRGRILGYSVLRCSNGVGHLADLLVLPARYDVLNSLVLDALDYFRAAQTLSVEYWTPTRHPYREVLRAHGFSRSRRTVPFLFADLRTAGSVELLGRADGAVHLMAGDSDLV